MARVIQRKTKNENVQLLGLKILNITATGKVPFFNNGLTLFKLIEYSEKNPIFFEIIFNENFPSAVRIKLENNGPKFSLFYSGKFVVSGARNIDILENAIASFIEKLMAFFFCTCKKNQ